MKKAHGRAIAPSIWMGIGIGIGIAIGIVAMLTACSPSEPPESPAARYREDPAALKRGKSLFVGTCGAYCHGLQPGNRDAPYLFDCEWKHGGSDEAIFRSIHDGVANTRMQAFADRMPEGDEDLWKIVAFLKAGTKCPS